MSENFFPFQNHNTREENARRFRYLVGSSKGCCVNHRNVLMEIVAVIDATPEPIFLIAIDGKDNLFGERIWLKESEWNALY